MECVVSCVCKYKVYFLCRGLRQSFQCTPSVTSKLQQSRCWMSPRGNTAGFPSLQWTRHSHSFHNMIFIPLRLTSQIELTLPCQNSETLCDRDQLMHGSLLIRSSVWKSFTWEILEFRTRSNYYHVWRSNNKNLSFLCNFWMHGNFILKMFIYIIFYFTLWVSRCNVYICLNLGCRGAGNCPDESLWSSNILHHVPASTRGKILHSNLHDNTLHAVQFRQHPGSHPKQTRWETHFPFHSSHTHNSEEFRQKTDSWHFFIGFMNKRITNI